MTSLAGASEEDDLQMLDDAFLQEPAGVPHSSNSPRFVKTECKAEVPEMPASMAKNEVGCED